MICSGKKSLFFCSRSSSVDAFTRCAYQKAERRTLWRAKNEELKLLDRCNLTDENVVLMKGQSLSGRRSVVVRNIYDKRMSTDADEGERRKRIIKWKTDRGQWTDTLPFPMKSNSVNNKNAKRHKKKMFVQHHCMFSCLVSFRMSSCIGLHSCFCWSVRLFDIYADENMFEALVCIRNDIRCRCVSYLFQQLIKSTKNVVVSSSSRPFVAGPLYSDAPGAAIQPNTGLWARSTSFVFHRFGRTKN